MPSLNLALVGFGNDGRGLGRILLDEPGIGVAHAASIASRG